MLKRQWSSLASAAFKQNFIIQYSFDAFQWLFGIRHLWKFTVVVQNAILSDFLCKTWCKPFVMRDSFTSLTASCFDKWHLGRSWMKISVQCKSGIEWGFVLAAFAAQVTHSFQAISGGPEISSVGAVMESCVPWRHLGGAFSGTGPAASPRFIYNPALTGILVCFRPKSCQRSKTMILLMMAKRFILMRITKRCSLRNSKRMLR